MHSFLRSSLFHLDFRQWKLDKMKNANSELSKELKNVIDINVKQKEIKIYLNLLYFLLY